MKHTLKFLCGVALISAFTLAGCAAAEESHPPAADEGIVAPSEPEQPLPDQPVDVPADTPADGPADVPAVEEPQAELVMYIKVTGDGVNIRGGPGSNYKVLGTAQKNTLYASGGRHGNWYKTYYKGMEAYIYKDYCILVEFEAAEEEVEAVIAEGTRHMGVKYVYGATRYHNGRGVRLSGFTAQAFDCSSLMQYIFKIAADVNLQMTTRTQVVQGVTVKDKLKRGDLMFFTNAARKNKTGVERIGHVAMYLGDNYIDSWQTFYIYANGSTQGMSIYLDSDMSEYTFVCPVNKSLLSAPDASSIRYTVEERLSATKARISLSWNAVENADKYSYSFFHSTSTGNGTVSGTTTGRTQETYTSALSVNIDSLYYFSVTALPAENAPYINSSTTTVRVIVGNE